MMVRLKYWASGVTLALLVACGGGGSGEQTSAATLSSNTNTTTVPSAQTPATTQTPTAVIAPPEVAQLTVSIFGSGIISDAAGLLDCLDQMCSKEYKQGAQVTIKAVASAGWKFNEWVGCQSTAANECTVSMNDSMTVHPSFTRTTETVIQENVVLLKPATLQLLLKNEGGSLIFDNKAVEIATLKIGNILVSNQGEGFARKVTSVIAIPGGNFVVDTTPATLTDVIKDGTLFLKNTTTVVTSANLTKGVKLSKLEKTAVVGLPGSKLTVDIPIGADGFGLQGEVEFSVNPEYALDVGFFTGLQELKAIVSPKLVSTLSVKVGKDKKFEKKDIKLGELKLTPLVFGPVVIVPSVEIVAHVKGEAKVEVTFGGNLTVQGTAGTHYYRGRGWTGVGSLIATPQLNKPEAVGSAEIEAGAGMKVTMLLWSVAGPLTNIGPYIKAESSIDPASLTPCVKWGLSYGVKAQAGGKVSVLAWDIGEYEAVLFDKNWPIVDSEKGACKDEQVPTTPGKPTVTSAGSNGLLLTWNAATDTSSIKSYDIFRDGNKIATTTKPTFQDAGLKQGQKYCYWVKAIDGNDNAGPDSPTGCGVVNSQDKVAPSQPTGVVGTELSTTAIRLSWQASSDNVGVTGYTISDTSGYIANATAATVDILKLQPGTQYCYSVTAFDEAGNLSPKSAQSCVSTKPRNTEAWKMQIKCTDQSAYVVTKNVDLDIKDNQNISLVGEANDYSGTAMAYQLFGGYLASGSVFAGRINWTFANTSNVRTDEFTTTLNTSDTGNVAMTQVLRTGCDAQIRFSKN